MNATPRAIHPATISEALVALDLLGRAHMTGTYGHICREGHQVLSSLQGGGYLETAFHALEDVLRMSAPSLGTPSLSAVEFFESGLMLHFGAIAFGRSPHPAIQVAKDLEASLAIHARACRQCGTHQDFALPHDDRTVVIQAMDRPDAILKYLTLSGQICDPLSLLQTRRHRLDALSATSSPLDLKSLQTRLSRAVDGFRHAAE